MPYLPSSMLRIVVEAKLFGVWVDVTARGRSPREARGVQLKQGRSQGAIQAEASWAQFRLGNDDGWLTPSNWRSNWFGAFGEGTPIRIGLAGILASTTYLFAGQIEECDPVYPGGESSAMQILATGALGVFLRSQDPPATPVARFMRYTAPAPLAWWPLTAGDERQTLTSPSGLDGGPPLTASPASTGSHKASGVVGGRAVGPPGSPVAIDLSGGGQLYAPIPGAIQETWRVELAFQFATPTTSSTSGQILRIPFGAGHEFWNSHQIINIFADDAAGARLGLTIGGIVSDTDAVVVDDGDWHHLRLDVSGSNFLLFDTDYELAIDGVVVMSGTATNVPFGGPYDVTVASSGDLGAASQLMFWQDTLPADTAGYEAFNAHTGERQLDRIQRVADEEGVTITIAGTDSPVMGPQREADLVTILSDCEAVGGMLFDAQDDVELVFRAHDDLINQTPHIAILNGTWTKDTRPNWSSRGTVNDVTVSRPGGATMQFEDAEHIARTQRRIRGSGIFPVNTDDQLGAFGGWLLHQGTTPDPRYLEAGWNLRNQHGAQLADAVLGLQPGHRVTAAATSFPDQHPPYGLDQIIVGWTTQLDADEWIVRPVMVPAAPYLPGTIGDNSTPVAGSWLQTGADTRLSAQAAAGATTATVTVDGPLFETDNTILANNPLTVEIGGPGGERKAVSDISGASSPQTFTFATALEKTWPANSPVQVFLPLALTI